MNQYNIDKLWGIYPLFKENNLNDIFPQLVQHLVKFREFRINHWLIEFDKSFNNFSLDQKYLLLRKIENKYYFDNIIQNTSSKMEENYREDRSRLRYTYQLPYYGSRGPSMLHLKHLEINDKLKFTIIVQQKVGRYGEDYYGGAGKFYIPLL